MYKDWCGVTEIQKDGRRDHLSISVDVLDEAVAVLLHIPDMEDNEHSHIELNKEKATILRDWLNEFIDDKDVKGKIKTDLARGNKIKAMCPECGREAHFGISLMSGKILCPYCYIGLPKES